jgi:hypothetical protein
MAFGSLEGFGQKPPCVHALGGFVFIAWAEVGVKVFVYVF